MGVGGRELAPLTKGGGPTMALNPLDQRVPRRRVPPQHRHAEAPRRQPLAHHRAYPLRSARDDRPPARGRRPRQWCPPWRRVARFEVGAAGLVRPMRKRERQEVAAQVAEDVPQREPEPPRARPLVQEHGESETQRTYALAVYLCIHYIL